MSPVRFRCRERKMETFSSLTNEGKARRARWRISHLLGSGELDGRTIERFLNAVKLFHGSCLLLLCELNLDCD